MTATTMRRLLRFAPRMTSLCVLVAVLWSPASHGASCDDFVNWLAKGCRRIADTYEHGENGLLVSGYSWHLPSTWTPEKRAELNPRSWGIGWSRTVEDPDGDSHSVFVLAFDDSHHNIQWNLGYEHSTYWGPRDGLQPGIGYTLMLVQRPDIAGGVPFPALLPLFSMRIRSSTLYATYIPTLNGGINNGSIIYLFGRIMLP